SDLRPRTTHHGDQIVTFDPSSSNRHPRPVQMDESTTSTAPIQKSHSGRRLVRSLSDVLAVRRSRLRIELSTRSPAAIKATPSTWMTRRMCPPSGPHRHSPSLRQQLPQATIDPTSWSSEQLHREAQPPPDQDQAPR